MYAITYTLWTGTILHRAPSAHAALEAMEMLRDGGGVVVKIAITQTGQQVSVPELQLLARRERQQEPEPRGIRVPRLPWQRRTPS